MRYSMYIAVGVMWVWTTTLQCCRVGGCSRAELVGYKIAELIAGDLGWLPARAPPLRVASGRLRFERALTTPVGWGCGLSALAWFLAGW